MQDFVKHEDESDNLNLYKYGSTDGTYVKEKTDWLIMSKLEEKEVQVESTMLHLDDLEHCANYLMTIRRKILFEVKSKNIDYKVGHPIFSADKKENSDFLYRSISRQNMAQGIFCKIIRLFRGK